MIRRRLRVEWAELPILLRSGLLVFVVGSFLDLSHHATMLPWSQSLEPYLGSDGEWAHVITLAGMVLIMVGILARRYPRVSDT